MKKFIIINALATYNKIFEQPLINTLWAIVVTYRVGFKFPTKEEEIIMKGNIN